MSERINRLILQNYGTYKKVRFEKKIIESDKITLLDKNSNVNFRKGSASVISMVVPDIEFYVEAHKNFAKNYKFGLISKSISERPFFRFDASGCTHNNNSPLVSLTLRQIKTPHFQYYDEAGYNTAYQTEDLKDPIKILELESDINKGASLFCNESVLITATKGCPKIERHEILLLFKSEDIDPLNGITFDEP